MATKAAEKVGYAIKEDKPIQIAPQEEESELFVTRLDEAFFQARLTGLCRHKNIMVCPIGQCTASSLRGVDVDKTWKDYQIWCFDKGIITTQVCCASLCCALSGRVAVSSSILL